MRNSERLIINVVRLMMLCVGLAIGYIVSYPVYQLLHSASVGFVRDFSYGFPIVCGVLMVVCGLI